MNQAIYPANLKALEEIIDTHSNRNERPLIGISANFREGNSLICNTYIQSVAEAGGIPFVIPVYNDINLLKETVARLDGLLLSGGADINPLYSNEEPIPALGEYEVARDQFDFTLLKLAADRQIPVFGICRGHQIINMAFGGTNYQDIYSQHSGELLKHSQSVNREYGSHTVLIDKQSVLYNILGNERIIVNSFHHQAVRTVAPGFKATATSSDGIIEAMEGMPDRRIFSVQWHPEKMATLPDEEMKKLFRYFTGEAALFKKAKAIHKRYPILDSHCDTPMKFSDEFDFGKRTPHVKVDLPKMEEGLLDAVVMVAYLSQGPRDTEHSLLATQKAIDILYRIAEQAGKNADRLAIAYTPSDLMYLKQEGKKAIFLGIENGYAIGKELHNLSLFKDMGITYLTLCHNGSNDICDSAVGEAEHNGLSEFGKKVVHEMNRLGIIIDVSHASEKSFFDILEESHFPIIASHSSARAICDHPRNLTDRQIKALAERGGVVQLCLYNRFLSKKAEPTIMDAIEHINHIVRLVGINHVGIGTDFDGDDTQSLKGCRAANELINLSVELLRQGYSSEDLGKLWGGNFMRVMNRVMNRQ